MFDLFLFQTRVISLVFVHRLTESHLITDLLTSSALRSLILPITLYMTHPWPPGDGNLFLSGSLLIFPA